MNDFATDVQLDTIATLVQTRGFRGYSNPKYVSRIAAVFTAISIARGDIPDARPLSADTLGEKVNQVLGASLAGAERGKEYMWKPLTRQCAEDLLTFMSNLPLVAQSNEAVFDQILREGQPNADGGLTWNPPVDDEALIAAEQPAPKKTGFNPADWDQIKADIKAAERKKSDGFYELPDGRIYKVILSQNNRLYAKRLVVVSPAQWGVGEDSERILVEPAVIEWEFEEGAMRDIKPEHKMTEEQARAYGELYGRCYECSRVLRNELSIALGIGPVCGGREFGGQFKQTVYAMEIQLGIRSADGKPARKVKTYK